MTPLEKRIKTCKEYLAIEISTCGPDTDYANGLREIIADCEEQLKHVSKDGYRMVTE